MKVTVDFDKIEVKEVNTIGTVKVVMLKGEKGDTGTTNYNDVENKPSIQGVTLEGDRTLEDIGAASKVVLDDLSQDVNVIEQDVNVIEQDVNVIKNNYITKAVNDLTNYYKKSETYTKTEINHMISEIPKFAIEVVTELPTQNISSTTVYLLKTSETESGNLYTEYIYINNTWESLGTQTLDLSGYVTTTTLESELKKKQDSVTGAASTITEANLTAGMALVSNSAGKVAASAVTAAEIGHLTGLSSNIQDQIDTINSNISKKQSTITGAATTITGSNLTANRALISNSSGKVAASSITSTQLGYLSGVTSNIQTQLNNRPAIGEVSKCRSIEITWSNPFIDFHFNNSAADYTSRLIESSAGMLSYVKPSGHGTLVAAAFTVISSRHVKTNITDISNNEAEKVLQLRPVAFDYKNGTTNKRGLIAEEVMDVYPELVIIPEGYNDETYEYDENGTNVVPSLDYSAFVPYLIKMVQIQSGKITELENRINDLADVKS